MSIDGCCGLGVEVRKFSFYTKFEMVVCAMTFFTLEV
jgi:hypothetical protein